jgi:hypothetical protein
MKRYAPDLFSLRCPAKQFRSLPCSAIVISLLVGHACLLGYGAALHSPVTDEPAHLVAGISYWHFGSFELYNVNPPLVRLLSAAPVVMARPMMDWTSLHARQRPEWEVGRDFIHANGSRFFHYVRMARWICIPLSLLGGYVCYRWATALYGAGAGILALILWCSCPNILAYGQLILPDMGATALGVGAAYTFWRWLTKPGWLGAVQAGSVLGAAELTKMTWIILFALWPCLWVVWNWIGPRAFFRGRWVRETAQLVTIGVLALLVINCGYGFQGSFIRLGAYEFISGALNGVASAWMAHGNRFRYDWQGMVPVPLPAPFVLGADLQKWELEKMFPCYLHGEWKLGGWWYFYLYALAIKVPLGSWCLLLVAVCLRTCRSGVPVRWHDELIVLAPAGALLACVSVETGFTHHVRYVLPILPLAFIWVSQVGRVFAGASYILKGCVCAMLTWSIGSSLWVYPHSLSYFNELVGGPRGGHAHLLHCNIDCGQDMFVLKDWIDQHPDARPFNFAYFGHVDPRVAGIEAAWPPEGPDRGMGADDGPPGPRPGWYAVSVTMLHDYRRDYAYFRRFRPIAMAGYSIYIYHISLEDANRVRVELGLAPVEKEGSGRP